MELRQRRFAFGLFAITLVAISVIQFPFFEPRATNVSYSEFQALARKGAVANLTLGKETISGTLSTGGLEGLLSKERIEELKRLGGGARARSSRRAWTIPGWWPSWSKRA